MLFLKQTNDFNYSNMTFKFWLSTIALLFLMFCIGDVYGQPSGPPGPPGGGGTPPCWPPPCIPIDAGASILIAAGLAFGSRKVYRSMRTDNEEVE